MLICCISCLILTILSKWWAWTKKLIKKKSLLLSDYFVQVCLALHTISSSVYGTNLTQVIQHIESYCFLKLASAWSFFCNSDLFGYYENGWNPTGKCANQSQHTPTAKCSSIKCIPAACRFTGHKKDPK